MCNTMMNEENTEEDHFTRKNAGTCPKCSSTKTKYYHGMLGYEALRCQECGWEQDLNDPQNGSYSAKKGRYGYSQSPKDMTDDELKENMSRLENWNSRGSRESREAYQSELNRRKKAWEDDYERCPNCDGVGCPKCDNTGARAKKR